MGIGFDDVLGFAHQAVHMAKKAAGKLGKQSSGGAADYFLKIAGIEGESEDEKHKGEIEILSFSMAANTIGTGGSGTGSGAGKVVYQDMHFVAQVSKASPSLLLACSTGQHFKEVVLTARKAGGDAQDYLTIKLT